MSSLVFDIIYIKIVKLVRIITERMIVQNSFFLFLKKGNSSRQEDNGLAIFSNSFLCQDVPKKYC